MHYHFEHPEFFEGIERTNFNELSGNLVIYGAGFQGLLAAQLLEEQGIKVKCFADQNKKKQGMIYHNLDVISPEEMKERYPNAVPIVTPNNLRPAFEYVRDVLGYKNAITPYSLFLDFDSTEFDKLKELPEWYHENSLDKHMWFFLFNCINVVTEHSIYSVDYSLTEVCNLRCKYCNAFMPNYDRPYSSTYEEVIHDLNTVLKNRIFRQISIEGGEALLWKPLPKLLRNLAGRNNLLRTIIYTNGTVIPDKELLDAMKSEKIFVSISHYENISKTETLSKILKENGIKFWVDLQKWYELANYYKNETPREYFNRVISDCCKAGGMGNSYISRGRLYRCPEQANLHKQGLFVSKEGEFVELTDDNDPDLQCRIDNYMNPKKLMAIPDLCHHCNGRGYTGKEVPPAEQLKSGERIELKFV